MATEVFYYRVWCETESSWKYVWSIDVPTTCPKNDTHTIDPTKTSIVDKVMDSEVILKDFRYLTGHNFYKKGFEYYLDTGQDTNCCEKFTANMYLCGGGYHIENTCDGDYCEFGIIDIDNILGYGENVVLATFISTDCAWENKDWEAITDDAKLIPQGIYLRYFYHSTGYKEIQDYSEKISGYDSVTGISVFVNTDTKRRQYYKMVDDGSGNYHVDMYMDSGLLNKIAHTEQFSSIGDKSLVADNSSGIGGTITVDALVAGNTDDDIVINSYPKKSHVHVWYNMRT